MRPPGFILDTVSRPQYPPSSLSKKLSKTPASLPQVFFLHANPIPVQLSKSVPKLLHHLPLLPSSSHSLATRVVHSARTSTRSLVDSITAGLFHSVKSNPAHLHALHHGPPTCAHSQLARHGSSRISRPSLRTLPLRTCPRPRVVHGARPTPLAANGPGQVGLSSAREFSSARGVFENVVLNVPLALRALGDGDWEGGWDQRKWRRVRREIRCAEKGERGGEGEGEKKGRRRGDKVAKEVEFGTYFNLIQRATPSEKEKNETGLAALGSAHTNEVDAQVGESVTAWLDSLIFSGASSLSESERESIDDSYSEYDIDSYASSSVEDSFVPSLEYYPDVYLNPERPHPPVESHLIDIRDIDTNEGYESPTEQELHNSVVDYFLLPSPPRSMSFSGEAEEEEEEIRYWPLMNDLPLLPQDIHALNESGTESLYDASEGSGEMGTEDLWDGSFAEWETVARGERRDD